jgi:hypothetical protein
MNSWQFNKIAGAVLGTGLLVLGLQNLGGAIFHPERPSEEKPGFKIAVAEAAEANTGGEASAAIPLLQLLAKADAKKGAEVARVARTRLVRLCGMWLSASPASILTSAIRKPCWHALARNGPMKTSTSSLQLQVTM